MTPVSFLEKYNIGGKDKDWLAITLKSEGGIEALLSKANLVQEGSSKKYFSDMASEQKNDLLQDITRLLLTIGEGRQIKRLTVGERAGVWADYDNTATNNPLFRFLDDIIGYGNYSIVGRKVEMGVGSRDSRIDQKAFNALVEKMHEGGPTMDVQMRSNLDGTSIRADRSEGHIFMGIGDYGWGIAIPVSKAEHLFSEYGKFIDTKKNNYTDSKYASVHRKLRELYETKGEDTYDADGKVTGKIFKKSEAHGDSEFVETMATVMWMDKMAGKQWWDHLSETTGQNNRNSAASVSKWAKRIRLMSNVSAKELSNEHVARVIKMH